MNTAKPSLAIGGTVVLWASAFPAIRVGLDGYGPLGLSLARLVVASVALAIAAPFLGVRLPRAKDLPLIALCGLTGMTAYQVLLNWGEVHVPAGTASLLVATAPVFSAALAAAFLGERLGARGLLGSAVALGGSALIALSGGDVHYTSAAWAVLAAALGQGAYHFCSKPLLRRYSGLEVACYAMGTGTLFSLPLLPQALHGVATAPAGADAAVLYLGLLPSALGFVLWGYGVARHTVTAATSALYLVPVVAIGVAYAWLGEVPTPAELAGGVISVGGVVLITARRRTRRGPAATPEPEAVAEPR